MKKREKKLQLNRETVTELNLERAADDEAILTRCTVIDTSCPRTTC